MKLSFVCLLPYEDLSIQVQTTTVRFEYAVLHNDFSQHVSAADPNLRLNSIIIARGGKFLRSITVLFTLKTYFSLIIEKRLQ